jgi:hypothetical protein
VSASCLGDMHFLLLLRALRKLCIFKGGPFMRNYHGTVQPLLDYYRRGIDLLFDLIELCPVSYRAIVVQLSLCLDR